jgi:chaperonin cofactor prefoldin
MSDDQSDPTDFKNLPNLLTEWKKLQEDKQKLLQEKKQVNDRIREHEKRAEAMQKMILPL